jgi:hypothetical protein
LLLFLAHTHGWTAAAAHWEARGVAGANRDFLDV